MNPDQYVLDFTSRANERCSLLLQLRSVPIAMNAGRVNGVIELLQRLTLFARYLPESFTEDYCVDAQVIALGARIEKRASHSERTVRRWTQWAKDLGLLDVRYTSKEFGGHRWNTYTVRFSAVLTLLKSGGRGRTRADTGGHHVRPQGRTPCPTPGADAVSAPLNVFNRVITNDSPLASLSGGANLPDDQRARVVVSALLNLSMSEDGARKAVRTALTRGLSYEAIDQLIEQYRALTRTDTPVTIGWLYRWLTGQSQPQSTKPPPVRRAKPVVERADFERMRQEARAAAEADLPLGQRLRLMRNQPMEEPQRT